MKHFEISYCRFFHAGVCACLPGQLIVQLFAEYSSRVACDLSQCAFIALDVSVDVWCITDVDENVAKVLETYR